MVANSGAAQGEAVEAALWAALEEQLELTRRNVAHPVKSEAEETGGGTTTG